EGSNCKDSMKLTQREHEPTIFDFTSEIQLKLQSFDPEIIQFTLSSASESVYEYKIEVETNTALKITIQPYQTIEPGEATLLFHSPSDIFITNTDISPIIKTAYKRIPYYSDDLISATEGVATM